jgi:hypothetical protein
MPRPEPTFRWTKDTPKVNSEKAKFHEETGVRGGADNWDLWETDHPPAKPAKTFTVHNRREFNKKLEWDWIFTFTVTGDPPSTLPPGDSFTPPRALSSLFTGTLLTIALHCSQPRSCVNARIRL